VEDPAECLVGLEALGAEDPEAGEKDLHNDADGDQQGEPVIGERECCAHGRGP
jgi:hypothetical protein